MPYKILQGNCEQILNKEDFQNNCFSKNIDLTFLDPPFNQDKYYASHDDNMPEDEYWNWMERITKKIYQFTSPGGAMYFMQREKNAEQVLHCLKSSGWEFQNLIIWKKLSSAVPARIRYGKQYQVIAFCTKGKRPRVFNRLRIDPPLLPHQKKERDNGIYLTDIWDDIRELTSGYFAGDEPLRKNSGERLHKQQSPIQLLVRIILSSSMPDDLIFDPFAGTGTTSVVSEQLMRDSISIELDQKNFKAIEKRLDSLRETDNISKFFSDYKCTENLEDIWPNLSILSQLENKQTINKQIDLFEV